jgi:hypothetical protein
MPVVHLSIIHHNHLRARRASHQPVDVGVAEALGALLWVAGGPPESVRR